MPEYLNKRGDYYYAFIQVPKGLRAIVGSAKKRKALGTTNRQQAKLLALEYALKWKQEFKRLKEIQSQSLSQTAIEQDLIDFYDNSPDAYPVEASSGRTEWIEIDKVGETSEYADEQYTNAVHDSVLQEAVGVASGSIVRLADYVAPWKAQSQSSRKTLDMAERDVRLLVDHFRLMENLRKPAIKKYLKSHYGHLSSNTQKRMVSAWRSFWGYLNDELEIDEPRRPFDDLFTTRTTKASRNKKTPRQAFSTEEIELLFRTAKEQPLKDLIKIAAYTGMRIEEICSKSRVDQGWLVIEDAKTVAGDRRVPIHPELLDGTFDRWFIYVANIKPNKYGNKSDAIGKRFGRLKTSLGFSDQKVFHSIRHTVSTELKRHDPSMTLIINELLGHEKPTDLSMGLYAKPIDEFKYDLIKSLNYNFTEL